MVRDESQSTKERIIGEFAEVVEAPVRDLERQRAVEVECTRNLDATAVFDDEVGLRADDEIAVNDHRNIAIDRPIIVGCDEVASINPGVVTNALEVIRGDCSGTVVGVNGIELALRRRRDGRRRGRWRQDRWRRVWREGRWRDQRPRPGVVAVVVVVVVAIGDPNVGVRIQKDIMVPASIGIAYLAHCTINDGVGGSSIAVDPRPGVGSEVVAPEIVEIGEHSVAIQA